MTQPATRAPGRRRLENLLTVAVAAFAFLFAVEEVHNYDLWWHLRTGEWILDHGRVPTADPFSFGSPGAPWVPHYWLSDVIFFAIQAAAGLDALILFKAAVVAAAFAVAYRLALGMGANPILAALLVGLAVPLARFRFLLRPHVFMFPLTVLAWWTIEAWGRERRARLLGLLPLMLLWVNLHASFFLVPVLLSLLLAEDALALAIRRGRGLPLETRPTRVLGLVLLGCLGATLCSPFGLELPAWVVTDFTAKSVTRSFEIQEHLPLRWGEHPGFWLLLIGTGTSFLLTPRRTRPFHLMLFGATAILALSSVRYVALASLIQAPLLARQVQAGLDRLAPRVGRPSPALQAVLGIPLLLVTGAVLFERSFSAEKVYRFGLGVDAGRYPVAAVDFLERVELGPRIFNSWKLGGYLLWRLPGRTHFIDGRSLDAQLEVFERVRGLAAPDFEAFLERLEVDAALLEPMDQPFVSHLARSERFALAFFDDQSLVFLRRRAGLEAAGAPIRFFELIQAERVDFSHLARLAAGPLAPDAEVELQRAVALAPRSFKTNFWYGFFLEHQDREEALGYYERAARNNPRLAFVHYDLGRRAGRLAMEAGDWELAVRLLESASQFREDRELGFLLGTSLYMARDFDRAERCFARLLRGEPDHVPTLVNLGFLYVDTGRAARARETFERARELAPDREDAWYGHALALEEEGRRKEADELWKQFLARFPNSRWAPKARGFLDAETAPPRRPGP